MKQPYKLYYMLLCLLCLNVVVAPATAAGLKDLQGQARSLDEFTGKGKWLVVMFWASDCHICNAEAANYNAFHEKYQASNATVLGLSLDGAAKQAAARAFVQRHALAFPNLVGEPETVSDLYVELTGAPWVGTPSFLIYSPTGRLKARQAGAVPVALIEDFIARESP